MSFLAPLAAGYTAEQVFDFIVGSFPHLGKRLRQARHMGHDIQSIIQSLQGLDKKKLKQLDERVRHSPLVAGQEATERSSAKGQIQDAAKGLAQAGMAAGAGYLAGRALQNVPFGKLANQFGNLLGGGGAPQTPQQTAQAPVAEAMGEVVPEQQTTPAQPSVVSTQPQEPAATEIIEEMQLGPKIKNLSANNPPEVVGAAIKSMLTPSQRSWLKGKTQKPIETLVAEYLQAPEVLKKPTEFQSPENEAALERYEKMGEMTHAEEKPTSKMVALPDGRVGELIEERQGIGSIKMPDGTVSRRKVGDLVQEPPGLEKQITELIEAIPEDERSAVLAFASYNPGQEFEFEGKKMTIPFMGVQFHNGDFYMYPGVSREKFDKVVSKATKAKTTGSNPWHAWTKGKESRGAGMHELIKEMEAEVGKNFIKFKAGEGYDYFKRIRQVIKELERRKRREGA